MTAPWPHACANCANMAGGSATSAKKSGLNSRLDELQAAILRVKLRKLAQDNEARRRAAARYDAQLQGMPLRLPQVATGREHVYHLYVVQAARRDALRSFLAGKGIATAVHYPLPVHRQPAYRGLGGGHGALPVSERLAEQVLSLPMFPQISEAQTAVVSDALREFYA